jgi:hypothetical protein
LFRTESTVQVNEADPQQNSDETCSPNDVDYCVVDHGPARRCSGAQLSRFYQPQVMQTEAVA